MTFRVYEEVQQGTIFTLCVVLGPLCTLATVLRFVSTKRAGRNIGIEDWFTLAALVFFLIYCGFAMAMVLLINGRQLVPEQLVAFLIESPDKFQWVFKAGYASTAQFPLNQTFAKFSLLALYYRLFSVDRKFVISLWVIAVLQGCWGIATTLVGYFPCTPVEKQWQLPTAPVEGTCVDAEVFLQAKEPMNSILDIAMAVLAVWMLRMLRIKTSTKIKVSILFMIGALSGIIGFIKMYESRNSRGTNLLTPLWDIVQMATSIICCTAPIYKSMFPDIGLITKLKSWSKSFTGSRGSKGSKGSLPPVPEGSHGLPDYSNKEGMRAAQPWLHLDWWSTKELTMVEDEVPRRSGNSRDGAGSGANVRVRNTEMV